MPGIVGICSKKMAPGQALEQLTQMVQALKHEIFYVDGIWTDESLGLYVGWVARRNSFCEKMPWRNERGDTVLVFSGEDFRETTISPVQNLAQRSDEGGCSYLASLYEREQDFPARLNGRFHGVGADRTQRSAMVFNDRYGMHRLYYHQAKDAFYFSAEAKAILAVRPQLRRIDPRALGEFITCGCVLENRTLFEGIHVLPPASKWVIRNGEVEKQGTYFQPREWEEQEVLSPDDYYDQLRDVFSRKLPLYFQSRGRIGMSLTGGLDTRMVMAWQRAEPGSFPCYTFGGMFRDCRDVTVARHVAKTCSQPHQVLSVGNEFLRNFPHCAERTVYLTDGCADVRRASDLYLNEQVREIAPIRMTGNYGGEVLRGVRAFKPKRPLPGLFRYEMNALFQEAEQTYQSLLGGHPVSFAVFKQAPWHHYGLLALEETQVSIRTPFLDNELIATVFRAPLPSLSSSDLCWHLIEDGNIALQQIPTEDWEGAVGPSSIVRQRGYRFLRKAEYAYDYGMPQWLASVDHVLSPFHLERLFLGRLKFNHYRVWYRDALRDYVRHMLLDPRTLSRPYLESKCVEAMVEGHLKGNRNYTTEIHTVLTLELLHRLLLDSN